MSVELAVLLAALALVGAGCWMAWPPLGPIVLGSLLLAGLIWTRLRPMHVEAPAELEEE